MLLKIWTRSIADRLQEHTTFKTKPLGKFSVVGDLSGQLVPNVVCGSFLLMYKSDGDELSYNRLMHMFKATVYSTAVTNVLKYTVKQKRPDSDNRDSFPGARHLGVCFCYGGRD